LRWVYGNCETRIWKTLGKSMIIFRCEDVV